MAVRVRVPPWAPIKKKTTMEIPNEIEQALIRYRDYKIKTGSFLNAVLSNDLLHACETADIFNRHSLYEVMRWIVTNMPSGSYGSPEAVKDWLSK